LKDELVKSGAISDALHISFISVSRFYFFLVQLVLLPLQEIQIGFGFTFLVPAHLGSPGQNPGVVVVPF